MDEKDKSTTLHASYRVRAVTFLTIGIIIVTGIFVCTLIFNQNHTVMAQQQQARQQQVKQALTLKGISFEIDNVTFSHHMASVYKDSETIGNI